MISNSKNFIFIHIPKTAGTSIEEAVRSYQDTIGVHQHENLEETFGYKDKKTKYFTFTVVRNPFDRMVSLYKHFTYRKFVPVMTFEEFVTDVSRMKWSDHPYRHRNFWQQYDWLFYNDKICMDYIMRFESLKNDWKKIKIVIDVNAPLPHVNKGVKLKEHYRAYYNKDTFHKVCKMYQKDIEYFDYYF